MSSRCNDPFISDSDDGWNPYGGTQSQEHTQVNEVGSSQVADHESNSNDDQLSTLRYSIHCKVTVEFETGFTPFFFFFFFKFV